MTGGLQVGLTCKAYYNAGTYVSPTWTLISTIKDLKLNLSKGVADASSRISTWKEILPVLKEGSIEYEILADTSLAFYDVLRGDFVNDNVVDMAIANGVIVGTGNEYFRADTVVTQFTRNEPLEQPATVSIKHELAYSSNVPLFVNT